jgi:hypothetical protein
VEVIHLQVEAILVVVILVVAIPLLVVAIHLLVVVTHLILVIPLLVIHLADIPPGVWSWPLPFLLDHHHLLIQHLQLTTQIPLLPNKAMIAHCIVVCCVLVYTIYVGVHMSLKSSHIDALHSLPPSHSLTPFSFVLPTPPFSFIIYI